jgi:hypothetical protein
MAEIFPEARRGLQYQDGSHCSDVVGTPFHIECKRGKKPNIRAALKQATQDNQGKLWIACVIRDDRSEPIVVMPFTDWLELIEEWKSRADK